MITASILMIPFNHLKQFSSVESILDSTESSTRVRSDFSTLNIVLIHERPKSHLFFTRTHTLTLNLTPLITLSLTPALTLSILLTPALTLFS